jgi:S-DNA-T family DNA segregation ATPase FtsK/SpoIIIE
MNKYRIPKIDILKDSPIQSSYYEKDGIQAQINALETQLENLNIKAKVVNYTIGPVIIRYELELGIGIKVNAITNLSNDLAMVLKATSVRIIAPILGTNRIGIEIPNNNPQTVHMKDIINHDTFTTYEDTLTVVLGKSIDGKPITMDICKTPHLLIGGQTGAGKSVGINTILTSLLLTKTPDELRLILIDPKSVELKPYENIPHLLTPVITSPENAVEALKWLTIEMDNRYRKLAEFNVRKISDYNNKTQNTMPYIVVVIDELADLMMTAGKEVESNIVRISQKARAVGIHLVLATQRPSVDVITGLIKANLPTRISFKVSSHTDSNIILDSTGAEKLLGKGDMLYKSNEFPEPMRVHGAYVSDEDCMKIADACSILNPNNQYTHIIDFNTKKEEIISDDPKKLDVLNLFKEMNRASISLAQRRLNLDYNRAVSIVKRLEFEGYINKELELTGK